MMGVFITVMAMANLVAALIYGLQGDWISILFSLNALATGLPLQLKYFG